MDIRKYTNANREAWNEVTPIHQNARKENYEELFRKKGYHKLYLSRFHRNYNTWF